MWGGPRPTPGRSLCCFGGFCAALWGAGGLWGYGVITGGGSWGVSAFLGGSQCCPMGSLGGVGVITRGVLGGVSALPGGPNAALWCPEGGGQCYKWGILGVPALPWGGPSVALRDLGPPVGVPLPVGGSLCHPGPRTPPHPPDPAYPRAPSAPPVDQCGDAVRPGGDHRAFGLRLAPPTFGLAPPPVQGWSRPFSDCPRPPRLAPPPIKFRFVTAPRPRAVPLRAPQAAPSLWAWLEREGATAPARVMASREWVWRLSFKGAAAAPRVEKGRGAPRPL